MFRQCGKGPLDRQFLRDDLYLVKEALEASHHVVLEAPDETTRERDRIAAVRDER